MHRITSALAALLVVGSGTFTAASASAAPSPAAVTRAAPPAGLWRAAAEPRGRVVSRLTLSIREAPTTHSGYLGGIQPGAVIALHCKVTGENVDGNRLWYLLGNGRPGYVAARYVQNLSTVPWC